MEGILKIAGQTEEIVRFGEAINKYDPVCVKFVGTKLSSTLPTSMGGKESHLTQQVRIAVAHGSPYTIYKRSGDTFTKLSDPSTLPTGYWA